MKFGETVWAIYDVGWKAIRAIETHDDLGRNFLPVILGTEEKADKIAKDISFFEVEECVLIKKCDIKPMWMVYDIRTGQLAESGDNALPLIFDNENDALDCADQSKIWRVRKASIVAM